MIIDVRNYHDRKSLLKCRPRENLLKSPREAVADISLKDRLARGGRRRETAMCLE